MDAFPPPRYRRFSTRPGPAPESASELPAYTRRNTLAQPVLARREPTEHVYPLLSSGSKPWATLRVYSSAKSAKSLPTFFEKENINGNLELDMDCGESSVHAITITVTGSIITGSGSDDVINFLNHTVQVWSKSTQSPRMPSQSEGTSGTKLRGHCVWPLSIPLPRSVNLPSGSGDTQSYRLPETFLERHTRASIQYDLSVRISRGKLRADSQIKTAFGYVPSTRPDPPSMLRQLAYHQGCPLPGPDIDPAGWKSLRPVTVRGKMFKSRSVEAKCTVSLAKPLCYSRGSVLPCFLTMEGNDTEVLDVLACPTSIVLSLKRRVRFYNKPSSVRQEVAWTESVENCGTAVWWPAANRRSDSHCRHLEGEFRLAKDLRPTSAMGHFSISYSVTLSPFDATNFTSANTDLISEPVEITTMHAKGPRPQAYSPPAYDPSAQQNNDYYASMRGFTTIG